VRVNAAVGDRIPAHCTSTGLALLASLDDAHVERLLPRKLLPVTGKTLTRRDALLAEVARIRNRGYAINRGGWRIDVGGIAAPIPVGAPQLQVTAGLCIALPLYRMTRPWIARTAPILVQYAARIGAALGASA